MTAPLLKGQIEFDLPRLSYIDTSWEEPAVETAPVKRGFAAWIESFREWRARRRAYAELCGLSDRELRDLGLNHGDLARILDDRFNEDLRDRAR